MKKIYQRICLALFRKRISRNVADQWIRDLEDLCTVSQKIFENLNKEFEVPFCNETRKDIFFHRGVLTKYFLSEKIRFQLSDVDILIVQATVEQRLEQIDQTVEYFKKLSMDNLRMIYINEHKQFYVPDDFKNLIKNTIKISI
jgi:hypothetical protein